MEVKLAEVCLQQARREQELEVKKERIRSEKVILEARQERIRSEKVILQAETAVLEAKTRAEAIKDQVLEEPLGVDPKQSSGNMEAVVTSDSIKRRRPSWPAEWKVYTGASIHPEECFGKVKHFEG